MAEIQQPDSRNKPQHPGSEKRKPILAFLGAVLSPGLGHLYSGRPVAAIVWFIALLLVLLFFWDVFVYWDAAPLNIILPLAALSLLYPAHIIHAVFAAARQPSVFKRRWFNSWPYYLGWWLVATVIGFLAMPELSRYEAFRVPTASMENAIIPGDFLLADVTAYQEADPQRGDIVVFIFPGDGTTKYVERCVGLPGDTIEVVDKLVYINGVAEVEPSTIKHIDTTLTGEQVIHERREGGQNSRDNFGPYVVPEGAFFMMGDNRDNSYDSRYWRSVPRGLLIGRVERIHFSGSWDRIGIAVE